jgi:hypothetical protein
LVASIDQGEMLHFDNVGLYDGLFVMQDRESKIGHFDRLGFDNTSWNSSHTMRGCNIEELRTSSGAGLFYCFAID